MTDPHDIDELASAQLDGTTSPDEDARLAGDPALRARVAARAAELRTVQRALAELPPVDESRREAAIAAALAAFDEDASPTVAGATVTPLAPRRGLSPRAVRAVSVAAVVLVLALLVPLLLTSSGRDDETASFEATGDAIEGGTTTIRDTAAEEDGQALSPEVQGDDTGGTAGQAGQYRQIGSYDDLDSLATAVASSKAAADSGSNVDPAPSRCPPPTSTSSMVLLAVVGGRPVEVYVEDGADGPRAMTVVDSDTCAVLDRREL